MLPGCPESCLQPRPRLSGSRPRRSRGAALDGLPLPATTRIHGLGLGDSRRGGAGGRGDPRRGQGGAGHAAVRGLQRFVHRRGRRRRARGLRARAGDHGHTPLRIRHLGGHPDAIDTTLRRAGHFDSEVEVAVATV